MIVGLSEVTSNDTAGCPGFLSLFSQCQHLKHHTELSDSNTKVQTGSSVGILCLVLLEPHSSLSPAPCHLSIAPAQPLIPPSFHNLGISRLLFIKSLAGCSLTSEQTHLAGFHPSCALIVRFYSHRAAAHRIDLSSGFDFSVIEHRLFLLWDTY